MLEYVAIQNFKSLQNVSLRLQPVNLLIGANNSGKSNFLKALAYPALIMRGNGVPYYLDQWYKKSEKKPTDELNIDLVVKLNDKSLLAVTTAYNTRKGRVSYGFLSQDYRPEEALLMAQNTFQTNNLLTLKDDFRQSEATANLKQAYTFLNALKIYKPEPSKFELAASLPNSAEVELAPDLANLIPFLFNLSQNHKRLFKALENDLRTCVPDCYSLGTPSEGGKLRLKIFTDESEETFFWAEELSDGVLYFLAILCLVHQPFPPPILLLEEPEKGIHPRRIHEVMQFLFNLADQKGIQLILTTQHPMVVEEFADRPECIFVFDKDPKTGATVVKNLQTDIIAPDDEWRLIQQLPPNNFTENLGDHWAVGLLGGVPR